MGSIELEVQVDALYEEWNKPGSPGCAIGIIKDGELIYKKGYGMANLEYDMPNTSKIVFRIGSTSKQFTAFCICLLEKEDKLSLDDKIQKYLPEMPEYKKPITIRNLIHHTSGIREIYQILRLKGLKYFDFDSFSTEDILYILSQQKGLDFLPGSSYSYSNSGYLLLSIIVERVSGQMLSKFAEEKIFKPLGMINTHFHDDHTLIVKNRATGYSKIDENSFKINESNSDVVGDGGIFTTIEDFLLWDRNFYDPIVGDQELITKTITTGRYNNGNEVRGDKGDAYAFGLMIGEYKGLKTIKHDGGWVGFRAQMLRFPNQKVSIIQFSNVAEIDPDDFVNRIADIYLKDEFTIPEKKSEKVEISPDAEIELTKTELEIFEGIYLNKRMGLIAKVSLIENILQMDVNEGTYMFSLSPIDKSKFKAIKGPFSSQIEFKLAEGSDVYNATVQVPILDDTLEFKGLRNIIYTNNQLKEYKGVFHSGEINCDYKFEIINSQLNLRIDHKPPNILLSPKKDHFFDEKLGISLSFRRDQQKEIKNILIKLSRIKLRLNKL